MDITVETRRLKVENVVGEAVKQVNVVRNITLPVKAKKIESIDAKIENVKHKIIDNKIVVEADLKKQVYYVECYSGHVQEYTVPMEKVTEFVHLKGAVPGMDARVSVSIEYCDVEGVYLRDSKKCYRQFQQTCILKIKVRVIEMVEIDVVTNVLGEGIEPTFATVTIDNIIGVGVKQHNISDSLVELPAATKKIKSIDAEIEDIEEKVIPGKVIVKGNLHKQIYYVLSPCGEVKEMSVDVPFTVFVPVEGARKGANISTDIEIEYIDSELITRDCRKFVRETVVIKLRASVSERLTLNIVTAVLGAEVDTRTLVIENAIGVAERQVNVLASIFTPTEARKISKVDAELRDLEGKAIPNKIIVKGTLHKQIYYVSSMDNQLRELSLDEPFTEFIHLDGAQEGDAVSVSGRIEYVNVEAKEKTPTCRWRQTAVLEIRARVTASEEITVVTAVRPLEEPAICPPGETFDYVVQRGDTLFTIATQHGVTVQQIMAVNPGIADPNTLSVGQVIKVPCPGLG